MRKILLLMSTVLMVGSLVVSCKDDDVDKAKPTVELVANFEVSPNHLIEPNTSVTIVPLISEELNVEYQWDFGDGGAMVWHSNAEAQSSFIYSYPSYGEYTITLKVIDTKGSVQSATQTINISPAPLKSTTTASKHTLEASSTYYLKDYVVNQDSVKWDIKLQDNGNLTDVASVIALPCSTKSYVFDTPGKYLLYLTAYGPSAKDGQYMRTDTVEVIDGNNSSLAKFAVTPSRLLMPSTTVTLSYSEVEGDDVVYTLDFGEQSGSALIWDNSSSETYRTIQYSYKDAGEYQITFTVRTNTTTESSTHLVYIDPAMPIRTISGKGEVVDVGFPFELYTGVINSDSVQWEISEIGKADLLAKYTVLEGKSAAFTFSNPGTYLLHEYAYGPGAKNGMYMRTDTVEVILPQGKL